MTLGRRSVARKKIDSAKRKWQNTAAVLDPKPLTLSKLFFASFPFQQNLLNENVGTGIVPSEICPIWRDPL